MSDKSERTPVHHQLSDIFLSEGNGSMSKEKDEENSSFIERKSLWIEFRKTIIAFVIVVIMAIWMTVLPVTGLLYFLGILK